MVVTFVDEKNKSQQGSCLLRGEKEEGPRVTGRVGTPLVSDFIYLTEGTVRCGGEQRQTPSEWFSQPGLNWAVLCFVLLFCSGGVRMKKRRRGKGLKEKAPCPPFLLHQN